MNIAQRQEQLSLAYVHAVAAATGITVSVDNVDDDSIDVTLKSRDSRGLVKRPMVELQLKATSQMGFLKEKALHFPLKIKNYDDLRGAHNSVPRLLVVMTQPKEASAWLKLSEEQLIMKHCAYWVSLRGKPGTNNTESVTIQLPRTQLFTPTALRELMQRLQAGGQP